MPFLSFIIEDIYFRILLTILFLYTIFLIAKGPLNDNRYTKNWWKRINSRGWAVIVTYFFVVIVYVLQSISNSNQIEQKSRQLKEEQVKRAEMVQEDVKREMGMLFESISTAFSKQGIKIDSLQNIISRQKEINYITNNKISPAEPYLHIIGKSLKIKDDGIYYGMYVKDAALTNINGNYTIYTKWANGSEELFSQPFLTKDLTYPANIELPESKLVNFKETSLKIDQLSIWFRGSYSNLQRSKKYNFDFVFAYDKEKDRFLFQYDKARDSILKLMENTKPKL